MSQANEFDVFVTYNSQDKFEVDQLTNALRDRGVKPWIDSEQILPGRSFQDKIQSIIQQVKSAVICIGLSGLGRWQAHEEQALIQECVERGILVIPVFLRGVEEFPKNRIFLRTFHCVRLSDERAVDLLVQGIIDQDQALESQPPSVEQQLESFCAQKKATEQKVAFLSLEIGKLESLLRQRSTPQQDTVLEWLKKKERAFLAKTYGGKALSQSQFKDLSQEIKNSGEYEKHKNRFYWELESYLELIYYAIIAGKSSMLDNPKIFPSLSNPDCYENASSDLYRQALDKIKERIPSSITEELKQSVEKYFDYMKTSLPLDD